MAEELCISVKADKTAIYVFDKTGKYQKKVNEGGYGDPNIRLSDVTRAEIRVFLPESEEPIVIDVYPSLPSDEGIGFEILAQELGLEEITSGIWKIEYWIFYNQGGEELSFCTSCYTFFDTLIACCIDDMKKQSDVSDPSSEANKKIAELETLFDNATWAAAHGDLETAQRIAKHISLQCKCCY